MALTIKNVETVRLARALAQQTGLTQTGAITFALRRALAESDNAEAARRRHIEQTLHRIWGESTAAEGERIQSTMDNLYDELGLPA
jgi:antitoxin VapB